MKVMVLTGDRKLLCMASTAHDLCVSFSPHDGRTGGLPVESIESSRVSSELRWCGFDSVSNVLD